MQFGGTLVVLAGVFAALQGLACDKAKEESHAQKEPLSAVAVVAIGVNQVTLDGEPAGMTLSIAENRLIVKVDELFAGLTKRSEQTKNPQNQPALRAVIQSADEVPMVVFKSVFVTSVNAGYEPLTIDTGMGRIDVEAVHAMADGSKEKSPPNILHLSLLERTTNLITKHGDTVVGETLTDPVADGLGISPLAGRVQAELEKYGSRGIVMYAADPMKFSQFAVSLRAANLAVHRMGKHRDATFALRLALEGVVSTTK